MTVFEVDCSVSADHPSLPGHFPGLPIVPGVLLLDRVLDGVQQITGRRVGRLERVKFVAALRPAEAAVARCRLEDSKVSFTIGVRRNGAERALASGSLSLLNDAGAAG